MAYSKPNLDGSPEPGTQLTPTRRAFIACGLTSVAGALLVSCGGNGAAAEGAPGGAAGSGGAAGAGAGAGSGGGGGSGGSCSVYPRQTEGPFYLDLEMLRADITEGKPGTPLALTLRVVSAATCEPMAGVAVDIWHCDADGVYSGFPGQLGGLDTSGQKFLRGTLLTDELGVVAFTTIYPGWYPGRTTHIHFKVHPTQTTEATSQLYFPEEINAQVSASPPYSARGPKDTSNAGDGVAGGTTPLAIVKQVADGYAAALDISVAG